MNVVLLAVLIVGGVGLIQADIWIPLVRSWKRKSTNFLADLHTEADRSGERFVIGPEKAVYCGGTPPYGAVRGNGTIILTDRRLIFRKVSGGLVDVPRSRITTVHQAASFQRSRVAGSIHLIIATNDPAEVAFFVGDLAARQCALQPDS